MYVVRFYSSTAIWFQSYSWIFWCGKVIFFAKATKQVCNETFCQIFPLRAKDLINFCKVLYNLDANRSLICNAVGFGDFEIRCPFFFTFTHRSMNYQNYYLHSKLTFVSTMNLDSHSRIEINPMLI